MAKMTPKQIYTAYVEGNHIDNVSLIEGVVFYKDLADRLCKCGPVFKLAFVEANMVYLCLRDFAVNRELKTIPEGY